MDETARYATLDEAKQAAEANPRIGFYHAYVYQLADRFDFHFHQEDRYASSFIPFHAKIRAHAEIKWEQVDGQSVRVFAWEPRGSNYSQEERDILADAGLGDLSNLLMSEEE